MKSVQTVTERLLYNPDFADKLANKSAILDSCLVKKVRQTEQVTARLLSTMRLENQFENLSS